jgi:hypothetical protein
MKLQSVNMRMSQFKLSTQSRKLKEKKMKKILLAVCLMSAVAIPAFAAPGDPGTGVLDSVHDMRISAGAVDFGGNDRVCAFCHTPHHAYYDADPLNYYPLWSRELDTNVFDPYFSLTINAANYAADIAVGPTRLCMSCHDGSIAPDQHYGQPGVTPLLTGDSWGEAGVGSFAGGNPNLANDHPIGFDYNEVAIGPASGDPAPATVSGAAANQDPWIRAAAGTGLAYTSNPYGVTVEQRLFAGTYMTCATCHDVHNKQNADSVTQSVNYLVLAPQADSAMCLTCHIK